MAASTQTEFSAHPHMLRRQAAIWTVVLGGGAVFGWFMLPAHIRDLFSPLQAGTLALFVVFMLALVWTVALGFVKADPQGMQFRNGMRTRQVPWHVVESIRYGSADHWAFVEFTDGTDRPLLGIQRSDGALADEQVQALRQMHAAHTGA